MSQAQALFQPGGRAASVVPLAPSLEAFLHPFPPPTQTCSTRPSLAALMSWASPPCGNSSSSGRTSSSSMTGTALDPSAPQSCSKVRAMVGTVGVAHLDSSSCLTTHPECPPLPSFHLVCTPAGAQATLGLEPVLGSLVTGLSGTAPVASGSWELGEQGGSFLLSLHAVWKEPGSRAWRGSAATWPEVGPQSCD